MQSKIDCCIELKMLCHIQSIFSFSVADAWFIFRKASSKASSKRFISLNRITTCELTSRIERISRVTLGREKSRCGRSGTIAFYRATNSPLYSSFFLFFRYIFLRFAFPPSLFASCSSPYNCSGSKWVCDAHHGNSRDPGIH